MINVSSKSYRRSLEDFRCRKSFAYFARRAWRLVATEDLQDEPYIDAVCDHLQAVTEGQITRLIINMPPGLAKSTLVAVLWPAWEWLDHPEMQSLFGSYSLGLADRDAERARNVIESDWYIKTFQRDHDFFSKAQNAKTYYVNKYLGSRYGFAMNAGSKTGWRGNKLVIDDPNDVKKRYDTKVKNEVISTYKTVLYNRVNDLKKSPRVIVQHRVAPDDLTGYLLEHEKDIWEHLVLQPEFRPANRYRTSIGWTDARTEEGQLLCEAKLDREQIDYLKTTGMGAIDYAAQYDQSPEDIGTKRFETIHFCHWKDRGHGLIELQKRGGGTKIVKIASLSTFVSVDCAASEKQRADWTVFQTWGIDDELNMILLESRKGRWQEGDTITQAKEIYTYRGYNGAMHACFVVEQNGLGLPIAQRMQEENLPVIFVSIHRTDKYVRSATASVRMRNGKIYFPPPDTPWFAEPQVGFRAELIHFPNAQYKDDQVDAFSLAAEALQVGRIPNVGTPANLTTKQREIHKVLERPYNDVTKQFGGKKAGVFD